MKQLRVFVIALWVVALQAPAHAQPVDATTLPQSQNVVGFQLFSKLVGESPQKNIVISPFSISEALLMAWDAADGAARDRLAKVLALQRGGDNDIKAQNKALLAQQGITVGNSLWVKEFNGVSRSFLEDVKNFFHAEVEPLTTEREINTWVSRVTNGVIKNIINSVKDLQCVIVNAIYFKELWKDPFDSKLTKISDFWKSSKDSAKRRFMNKEERFSYFEESGLQAVELPYQKKGLAMVVFLPPKTLRPADFPKQLTANWATWLQKFSSRHGTLSLPNLKLDYDNDTLADMMGVFGLPVAAVRGVISKIIHKTCIKVDEKGTEAAAATAVMMVESAFMGPKPPPPFVMKVNRPYFFAIYNKDTHSILFLGFITDPVQE